jgi:hypothetical protein
MKPEQTMTDRLAGELRSHAAYLRQRAAAAETAAKRLAPSRRPKRTTSKRGAK